MIAMPFIYLFFGLETARGIHSQQLANDKQMDTTATMLIQCGK